jgi:hypothetical protein
MITLHVDDLFIFTNDFTTILLEIKEWLKSKLQMTYQKKLKQCISTNKMYIFDIYKRFNMENNKVINVPLETGLKLTKDHSPQWKEEIDVMNTIYHMRS